MREETKEKYLAVKAMLDEGSSIDEAVKAQKMSHGTYYLAKKEFGTRKKRGSYNKTKNKKKPGATFVDLPLKAHQPNVAVIICTPDQLKSIR